MMRSIAIIPARSGSKGLPDKNILPLKGKPLMYYSIQVALNSGCFDTVMVSTDSEKYASIAGDCGAEVPFLRSCTLSGDTANSWDAVREVLKRYSEAGKVFDYIVLMQPTSPLRTVHDVKGIFALFSGKDVKNAVTVTEVDHPVQWCFSMPEDHSMRELASSPYRSMRRQELKTHYRENGAIYMVDAKKIMDREYNFYADGCFGYVMPRERSIDIDTRIDLVIAETYMGML